MSDAPEWEDRYHPPRVMHSGNAPKGWSDEFRFCPYVRADIAAAREAELRAEVERLKSLIGRYINHVGDEEGAVFLDWGSDWISDDEVAELKALDDAANLANIGDTHD